MFLLFNNFYNMTNEIDETFFIFGFEWFNNSCAHDSALFLLKGLYEDIDLDTRLQLMNFSICPILGEWLELTSWHDSAQFSIQRKDYLLAAYIDYIRNLQDHPHTKYMAYTDNYDCWHSPKVGAFACLFLMLHSCSTDMLKVGMHKFSFINLNTLFQIHFFPFSYLFDLVSVRLYEIWSISSQKEKTQQFYY